MQLIGDKLSAVRGERAVFSAISFNVGASDALLLTGPNGAGKTTLLRILAGFRPPTAGAVRLEGGPDDRPLREHCHYVGHANAVKGGLTVGENARFWSGFLGGHPAQIEPALQTFGIAALRDIPAAYLSAGQKRRLGLARLLLAERAIWLLDEPTSALDTAAQAVLERAVNAHLASGGIAIAATHAPLAYGVARELALGMAAEAA